MRVLITGHNGYIGSVMAPYFQSCGHEVTGLDNDYFRSCTFGKDHEGVPSIRKDIRDVATEDLRGFDAVVHLAALSNDPLGEINPDLTYDINHLASVRLAERSKEAGVRYFLYSSSCSMYGAAGGGHVTEEAPFHPITPYAISKVRTENDVRKLAGGGFSPVFMRNATVYGASPRFRADLVLNNLSCWAFATGRIRILSDGTPWRPIVHVEDVSRAFAAVLEAPLETVHNQAFNVGVNSENYQVRDIAAIVETVVPGCMVEYAKGGGPDPRSYRVDFSKIIGILHGFRPKWDVRQGADELHNAFRRFGLNPGDFQDGKYVRLAHLKSLISSGRIDEEFRWKN